MLRNSMEFWILIRLTRLLIRNSVFNPKNFINEEGKKMDDLAEKQRFAQKSTNHEVRKSKIRKYSLFDLIFIINKQILRFKLFLEKFFLIFSRGIYCTKYNPI